jgi:N-acetylmuramate 1-kinase
MLPRVNTFRHDAANHPMCQVTRLFQQAELPVPQILHVSEPDGLMLLEDLGDVRLQDWFTSANGERRRDVYREAIDLILRIQAATTLAAHLNTDAARLAFDEEKLGWELSFFYENFFERLHHHQITLDIRTKLFDEFEVIAKVLASLPRVLCHRDYHSRNLMMHQGKLVIIDHQDARMGPASYDLASLLGDPYVDLAEGFCQELLEYFIHQRANFEGIPVESNVESNFEEHFQLMLAQRLLKTAGTYAFQTAVVGNIVYLDFIPKALTDAMKAVRALGRFPAIQRTLEQFV